MCTWNLYSVDNELQQHLPLAVLKLHSISPVISVAPVATALTACGIETAHFTSHQLVGALLCCNSTYRLRYWNLHACNFDCVIYCNSCNSTYRLRYWNPIQEKWIRVLLMTCCNSTYRLRYWNLLRPFFFVIFGCQPVATALTACGIETLGAGISGHWIRRLQQHLPLAVLKLHRQVLRWLRHSQVATALTACGIETWMLTLANEALQFCCNSTYRLRYWNQQLL